MEIDPMHFRAPRNAAALSIVLIAVLLVPAEADTPAAATEAPAAARPAGKQVLLPESITRVPRDNDFDDPESEFCHARSKSTDNFVLFWAKEYGDDPAANEDERRRFNVDRCLSECERFFDFYVNTLKWVDKETSVASRYKFLIFVFGGRGGTAFGGAIDDKIGALWTPAVRINREPYGVLAHELGHSFQALLRADSGGGFRGGAVYEMTAQYMLWQVYPEWMTFENYHLVDFMRQTHLAFLHQDNMYHSCYPLEYWSNKHGARIHRRSSGAKPSAKKTRCSPTSESPASPNSSSTTRCSTPAAASSPGTCRGSKRSPPVMPTSTRRRSSPQTTAGTRISPEKCPQNYGYNAIELEAPAAGTTVQLQFEGLVGAEGYRSVQPRKSRLALRLRRLARRRQPPVRRHVFATRRVPATSPSRRTPSTSGWS